MTDEPKLVALETLEAETLELLAQILLPAAQEHAPAWLRNLDDAREQIVEALAPDKIARVLIDAGGAIVAPSPP